MFDPLGIAAVLLDADARVGSRSVGIEKCHRLERALAILAGGLRVTRSPGVGLAEPAISTICEHGSSQMPCNMVRYSSRVGRRLGVVSECNFLRMAGLLLAALGSACRAADSVPKSEATSAAQSLALEIGSTRNARVARLPSASAEQATFLAGPLDPEELVELARAAPAVRIIAGLTRESALQHAAAAHGAMAHLLSPVLLDQAPNLVWVQAMSAGVEQYMDLEPIADGRVVFTNMRAVHGPAIAEHAFAMLLALTRNLRAYSESQTLGRWQRESSGPEPITLTGRTLLVVGLGGIGTEIAQRAHGLGMRVIATRRSQTPAPAFVARLGGAEELLEFLAEADVAAICVPLTDQTRGLFDSRAFQAMKPGSYLVNIARGEIVETGALMAALDSGHLAGACLDVTDPEPLPADHPLWKYKNVLITPHMAASSQLTGERRRALLHENLRRFGAGEPLLNVVDPKAGY